MAKKKDYEVGYGRPPKKSQFRKGQSGNPSGRPKKILTHEEIVARELNRKVTITVHGKEKRLTKRELMHIANIQKAIKGDFKAFKAVIELDQPASYGLQVDEEPRMVITLDFPEEEENRRRMAEEERRRRHEAEADDPCSGDF